MVATSPEAAAAIETLRQSGFRITSHTGAYRLVRSDGTQAQLYRSDGRLDAIGILGLLSDLTHDQAAINAVPIMQAILRDESQRLALPRPQFGLPGSYRPAIG